MSLQEYRLYRTRLFVAVQAILALSIVGVYLYMVVSSREVASDFAFVAGLVIAFFFDEVRRNGNQMGANNPDERIVPPVISVRPDKA